MTVGETKQIRLREIGDIVKNAPPVKPLWGDILFQEALTFITGEAGICKTTLGYKLAIHITQGKEFLGYTPLKKTNVAYFDFESADSLIGSRMRLLQPSEEVVPGFWVYNEIGYYLPEVCHAMAEVLPIHNIGLIIIDNQSTAFPTHDENDSSEARKQMQQLRELLRRTGCAGILFHHPGKANLLGINKGRGSSARPAHADVVINLDKYEFEGQEYIHLTMSKNRFTDDKPAITFQKQEGNFVKVAMPVGLGIAYSTEASCDGLRREILSMLKSDDDTDIVDIANLPKCSNVTRQTLHYEINRLMQYGLVVRSLRGKYRLRS